MPTVGYFGRLCKNVFSYTLKVHATRYRKIYLCLTLVLFVSKNNSKAIYLKILLKRWLILQGDLLIMNALTAEPYCGCDPLLLRQYYFPPLRLCYEHHTRGPCESGLLFAYNHTADLTHCLCAESLANFHLDTQQCFQFGSKGPCRKGQVSSLEIITENQ